MALSTTRLPPLHGLHIHVYRNGDKFYKGRHFVVNPKQVRNFDALLTLVTTGINSRNGAVRKIYTPTGGHKVNNMEGLRSGGFYVAGGTEKFIRMKYDKIEELIKNQSSQKLKQPKDFRRRPNRLVASARIFKPEFKTKTILIYTNGDELIPPVKLLLTKKIINFEHLLSIISDRVGLQTGAVRKLCSLDGHSVQSIEELVEGKEYVAVGSRKFKKLPYGASKALLPPIRKKHVSSSSISAGSSLKSETLTSNPIGNPAKNSIHGSQNGIQGKSVYQIDREGEGKSKKNTIKAINSENQSRQMSDIQTVAEEKKTFPAKPVKVKNRIKKKTESKRNSTESKKNANDNGKSVFKATNMPDEVKNAKVVHEDKDTAVEKTVDMMAAEEVNDELIEGESQADNKALPSKLPISLSRMKEEDNVALITQGNEYQISDDQNRAEQAAEQSASIGGDQNDVNDKTNELTLQQQIDATEQVANSVLPASETAQVSNNAENKSEYVSSSVQDLVASNPSQSNTDQQTAETDKNEEMAKTERTISPIQDLPAPSSPSQEKETQQRIEAVQGEQEGTTKSKEGNHSASVEAAETVRQQVDANENSKNNTMDTQQSNVVETSAEATATQDEDKQDTNQVKSDDKIETEQVQNGTENANIANKEAEQQDEIQDGTENANVANKEAKQQDEIQSNSDQVGDQNAQVQDNDTANHNQETSTNINKENTKGTAETSPENDKGNDKKNANTNTTES